MTTARGGDPRPLRGTRENLALRTVLFVLVLFAAGVGLLIGGQHGPEVTAAISNGVGVASLTTAIVALGYELWVRRTVVAETLALAELASEVHESGIDGVSTYASISWHEFFAHGGDVDILVTYGRTFAGAQAMMIMKAVTGTDRQVRVIVLDPEADQDLLATYARKFHSHDAPVDVPELQKRIGEAIAAWRAAADATSTADRLTIEYMGSPIPYTFYRSGDAMWFVPGVAAPGRAGTIIAILCSKTGKEDGLWDFVMADIGKARAAGRIRKFGG